MVSCTLSGFFNKKSVFFSVFENYGQLAVKQGRRVLPVLVHILAPLPVSTIAKRFHSFTGSKSLKPGEYASSCNIDDMAKQTEVMKRVHQYLSRMCVEQNETQNGFAEKVCHFFTVHWSADST